MRSRFIGLGIVSLIVMIVSSVQAQGGGGGMGGMGGGGGRMHGGGGGRGMRGGGQGMARPTSLDPAVLEGPMTPGAAAEIVELSDSQRTEYATRYEAYMAATAAERDSAQLVQRRMQQAFEAHDFQYGRAHGKELSRFTDDLSKQENAFEDNLKNLFTKSQMKAFRKYRDEERKQAEEARRQDMERRTGAGGNGS
jgi:hypothetical protein